MPAGCDGYIPSWELEEDILAPSLITAKQRGALLEYQGGVCAICGRERDLVVDHDHITMMVRGLLCGGCNSRLGNYRDSPPLLIASGHFESAAYLKNPPAKSAGIFARYPNRSITRADKLRAMWTAEVLKSVGWGPDRDMSAWVSEHRTIGIGINSAADRLLVSPRTIRNRIESGDIVASKHESFRGWSWRVCPVSVAVYKAERAAAAQGLIVTGDA